MSVHCLRSSSDRGGFKPRRAVCPPPPPFFWVLVSFFFFCFFFFFFFFLVVVVVLGGLARPSSEKWRRRWFGRPPSSHETKCARARPPRPEVFEERTGQPIASYFGSVGFFFSPTVFARARSAIPRRRRRHTCPLRCVPKRREQRRFVRTRSQYVYIYDRSSESARKRTESSRRGARHLSLDARSSSRWRHDATMTVTP